MEYVCLLPHARHSKDLYSNESERLLEVGNIDLPHTHMRSPTTAGNERSACINVGSGFINVAFKVVDARLVLLSNFDRNWSPLSR